MARIAVVLAVLGNGLLASAGASTCLVTPGGTGDYPTIQAAVDAATAGDPILPRIAFTRTTSFEGVGTENLICALSDTICADEMHFSVADEAANQSMSGVG